MFELDKMKKYLLFTLTLLLMSCNESSPTFVITSEDIIGIIATIGVTILYIGLSIIIGIKLKHKRAWKDLNK